MDEITAPAQQDIKSVVTELIDQVAERVRREKKPNGVYANNCNFEPSVWDMKINFGELQRAVTGNWEVFYHTAVTMPWMQAKLLAYYLLLNIAYHEKTHGPITIIGNMTPTVAPPTEDQLKDDPNIQELFELYKKIHADMFGS